MAQKKKTPSKSKPVRQVNSKGLPAAQVDEALGKKEEDSKVENFIDDEDVVSEARKIAEKISKCYENKSEQTDNIGEYWNIYNACPDENQQYMGNSTCYIPAVRDSINSRVKRTLKTLFPVNHKHVDALGPNGDVPFAEISMLENYIRQIKLKSIVRACLIAGDVTGQWSLYADWTKTYRTIREIIKQPPIMETVDGESLEMDNILDDEEDVIEIKEVVDEMPEVSVIATEDLAVYPPTVDDIEKSIASSVRLRMSEDQIRRLKDQGIFSGEDADDIAEKFSQPDGSREKVVPEKKRSSDVGVKTEGTYKYVLIHEIACDLKLDGDRKEPCYIYAAGKDAILGIIRNPMFCGKRPVISASIENISGSFFGKSKIEPVKFLQWNLNDFWNMGMDSAQYALLPIIMTDPMSNPNYQSMVMGLAAVWLTDPNKTKFQSFPDLWRNAGTICEGVKRQIWESMDVNEAMMGKAPQGRKNNQAIGSMMQEQQTNIMDHAERFEEVILNPLIERMAELDRQFRTEAISVPVYGETGYRSKIQEIEPQQYNKTIFYWWCGTTYQMNMQRIQQMISWMNVLRGIPPQLLNGRRLDVTPIIEFGTEQIFGPDLSPKILIDERNLFTIPPDQENIMLHNGLPVEVHEADDDQAHIQAHNAAAVMTQDPQGMFRAHITMHQKKMVEKMKKAMGAGNNAGGVPGVPSGAAPQGVAGTPRIGAQPGQPRMQQPAGAVHEDQMVGVPGRG